MSQPHVWAPDERNEAEHLIRQEMDRYAEVLRQRAAAAPSDDEAKPLKSLAHKLEDRTLLARIMDELKTRPEIVQTVNDFDQDDMLLNTPAGIVDLETGKLSDPDPDALLSKTTAVAPDFNQPPTRWLQFLDEATGGDTNLQIYLQKLTGYSLTGKTDQQILAFIHGPPSTGKTKFIDAIGGMMGSYHEVASTDTFAVGPSGRHPADLAKLAGARLVTAAETHEGRAWDTQRVKTMTGGDRISARFMRENFFTYTPKYQIIIVGNHEPEIHGVDAAMMRRLHVVPFEHKPKEVDRLLGEKLKEEWPGILAWAIEGCLKWLDEGLAPPPCVVARTEQYRSEEDPVGQFLEERCVFGPEHTITRRELYVAWQQFCHEAGEQAGSLKTLKRRFKSKETEYGFEDARVDGARGYLGVALKTTEDFV